MNGFLTLLLKTGISGLFFWCIFLSGFVSEFLFNHIGFWAIHFSSMFDFIRRIFCCDRKNSHWQRDMFTIPCPEEVDISTELSSGLGRRLPCYNTSQCAIVVKKENRADMPEITDERLKEGPQRTKSVVDSQLHANKIKERRSWR